MPPDRIGSFQIDVWIRCMDQIFETHASPVRQKTRIAEGGVLGKVDPIGTGEKIIDHGGVIEWYVAHLPGARFAKTGNGRIADDRCCLLIAKYKDAAKMIGPVGIMPEDELVRHQRILPYIAAELGEFHHPIEHGIVPPGIGHRDKAIGEIAKLGGFSEHVFG